VSFNLRDYIVDFDSIRALATIKGVKFKFNDKLEPLSVKRLNLKFEDSKLIFDTKESSYKKVKLKYSRAEIESIFTEPKLKLLLDIDSPLDMTILQLLKGGYDIDIPISQIEGSSRNLLKLSLNLASMEFDIDGVFKPYMAKFNFQNIYFKNLSSLIYIKNSKLSLKNSYFKFEDILFAKADISIDLSSKRFDSNLSVEYLNLNTSSDSILYFKDKKITIAGSFGGDSTELHSKELDIKFLSINKSNYISIGDISKLYINSHLLQKLNIKNGSLDIKSSDFKRFVIFSNLKDLDTPLYKNGKFIGDINLVVEIDGDEIKVISNRKDLSAYIKDNKIDVSLRNFDIFLPDFDEMSSSSKEPFDFELKLRAENTNLYFGGKLILSESFWLFYSQDKMIFETKYKNASVKISKNGYKIDVKANNLDEVFFKSFFHQDNLEGGLYNLTLNGDLDIDTFTGILSFQNVTIKNLILLNNLVAFLDSLPAIITFEKPGFSRNGYEVLDGNIEFAKFKDSIYIRSIDLKGKNIDIKGAGRIYLDSKTIDIWLDVITIKNLSKIINKIPLVGYIVLGDGTIATRVSITGALSNPKIDTNIIKDTIKAPINMIERTLSLPNKLIEYIQNNR
jgi:hypothetical protein